MKKETEENLKNAFAGESQAHMKYMTFADKAEKEDLPNVARLFRANSFAEQVHAANHLRTRWKRCILLLSVRLKKNRKKEQKQ